MVKKWKDSLLQFFSYETIFGPLKLIDFIFSAFERKLISSIEEVKVQVKLNTSLLQNVLKRIDALDKEEHEGDAGEELNIDLPLINKDKVMALEESLKTENTLKRMVCINKMIFTVIFLLL